MNSSIIQEKKEQFSKSNYSELKIKQLRPKIIQSIKDNLITFISSKTGSGKSTQVPQYLYDYLLNEKKKKQFCVLCIEPRSIACESISKYIGKKNKNINISTRNDGYFEKKEPNLLFLRESDLLYLLKKDPELKNCDILIMDEVHERTMKLDLLLYYIKHFTLCENNKKRGFKLVLMSATFNTDDIHNYFSSVNNKDITFGFINDQDENNELNKNNYDIIYVNSINNSLYHGNTKFNELNMGKILREISKIIRYEVYLNDYEKKTILVFLPDYKTIYSLYNMLNKEYKGYINIYQFFSALNIKEQKKIINELYEHKYKKDIICNVIIATTLAETCLTFPNCDIVIDSGLRKNCRYNYDSNLYEEVIEYISQDSCIQRSGRCGRENEKGICYRLFSEESYYLMDKYRKPEIETGNIDLIILRLFDNDKLIEHVKKEVKEKGYLDFLSNVNKDKFDKIVNILVKYNAIEKKNKAKYETPTIFGNWLKKTNMDIELGYYFNEFKNNYPNVLKTEVVFQLLNIISTTDNYNSESFYSDIDPEWFKLRLINNNKDTKENKLIKLSQNISKNIINMGLKKYIKDGITNIIKNGKNEEEKNQDNLTSFFKTINHISPYYSLFSKLDEIYNGKNFYTKNKIFQLGDWIITLFFTNQYKLIKCLRHYYLEEKNIEMCEKCQLGKYFYCSVYSLNEKYFISQKNRAIHIKKALEIEDKMLSKDSTVCKNEELVYAKWNMIYLNLISKKPDKYINENQIIKYINEFKEVNFESIMNTIYEEYKKLYIEIATKYLKLTKNDDEMLIQRKIFQDNEEDNKNKDNNNNENKINEINTNNNNNMSKNNIVLYFNKIGKANLLKSYFFEFIPNEIDKYFCLTKFRKILGNEKNGDKEIKLSKLYFKVINPIFDEMISQSHKIKNHFKLLKENIIDKKEIKIYNNIGKYFYFHFIYPKLINQNIEVYHNSIAYLYSKDDKDIEKEDKKITELINNERENYYNMLDFIQCLKGGCMTIQLTQGLSVKNIYDTYQNRNINKNELLYEIEPKKDPEEKKDIKYYHKKITENSELKHEKLLILKDKLIIVFRNSLQFSLFSERQNLDLKLVPYKENIELLSEENDENNYINMKIYIVKFDYNYPTGFIHKEMKKFKNKLIEKYNYRINYFLDESIDYHSKAVYYYINSDNSIKISQKDILGEECKENLNQKVFSINWLSFTSDYDYFPKFRQFCRDNNLNIVYKRQNKNNNENKIRNYSLTKTFELINYSIENMKLIQNYIGFTTISLNSFAILELKSKSKDTFLEYNQNIFQYARNMNCNITIIYYENKITIYGEPRYRKRLYEIISEYFSQLQNEKIIFSLKGKEDNLLLKTISRKVNQKQIVMLVSKNEQGLKQLEFRKKYYDEISKLLFQQKKGKKKTKIKSTRCEICLEKFDNENNNNYFKLKLCGHKFCIECLKMQICDSLKLTTANSLPIKCVKCNTIITNKDIFEIIIPNTPEYDFIIDKLITIFMINNTIDNGYKKYYWCPNKKENCNYIYNSQMKESGESNMTCPNCNCKICLLCNDILDPNIPHNPDCQSKLYSTLSSENRSWILKNSKDCPMCHTVYEKNQGCNHMTCTICRPPTHFCYICGNILNNENPLKHFSDKDSKCYNKLWDDESKNNIDIETDKETITKDSSIDENNEDDYENNRSSMNTSRSYNNSRFHNRGRRGRRRSNNTDDLNLTRIMIEKVSHNNSYKSNNYRAINYSNSRDSKRRPKFYGYKDSNSYQRNNSFNINNQYNSFK